MFISESKSLSTHTHTHTHTHNTKRTHWIGAKQLFSLKKTTDQRGFNLLGSIKIGLWSDEKGSCSLMSPDLACYRVMGASR